MPDISQLPPTDLRRIFQLVLEEHDEYQAAVRARHDEWRAKGYTVIDGDNTSGQYVLHDERTDDVIFRGDEAAHEKWQAEGQFVHIDFIHYQAEEAGQAGRDVEIDGLPRDLVTELQEWIWNHEIDARRMLRDWAA